MARRVYVDLIEDNLKILDWLNGRVRGNPNWSGYTKQQFATIVRLRMTGRAKLKDIAKRNDIPSSNLCLVLKGLESDGLVSRQVDDDDRRNTWYALSPAGNRIADRAMADFRKRITKLFARLDAADEARLTSGLQTLNDVLNKLKSSYNNN